jgi:hypothetical protein
MGNSNNTQQSQNDRLSTESLNGSGYKEKSGGGGGGWKFSTVDDQDDDYINENDNLLENESEDEKDGNYSTNFKNIVRFLKDFIFV